MAAVFWESVGNTKLHKGWPASQGCPSFPLVSTLVAVLVPVLLMAEISEATESQSKQSRAIRANNNLLFR